MKARDQGQPFLAVLLLSGCAAWLLSFWLIVGAVIQSELIWTSLEGPTMASFKIFGACVLLDRVASLVGLET
jgi:hypothetical protein